MDCFAYFDGGTFDVHTSPGDAGHVEGLRRDVAREVGAHDIHDPSGRKGNGNTVGRSGRDQRASGVNCKAPTEIWILISKFLDTLQKKSHQVPWLSVQSVAPDSIGACVCVWR